VAERSAETAARKPELIRVSSGVYAAHGFAAGNVHLVLTTRSVVVIDTTESVRGARAVLAELRQAWALPVSHIIYTHFHGEHVGGATAFHTPATRVVAQRNLPEELARQDRLRHAPRRKAANGYVPPDVLFDDRHRFEEGGVAFELSHAPGETADHLAVWLPGAKVLFCGDLFYNSFPLLSGPRAPDQPVLAWAESLERLRALGAEHLVPAHGRPLAGAAAIDAALGNYAEAIRFVHDETVRGIREGVALEHLRNRVQLPGRLARLPYLQERYGTVAWSVNGIFRQYTGWSPVNPKDLDPSPRHVLCRALVEACGGSAALNAQARQALEEGRNQLALELADVVLGAGADGSARALRAEALRRLAGAARSRVARDLYRAALRGSPGVETGSERNGRAGEAAPTTSKTSEPSRGDDTMAAGTAERLGPGTDGQPSRTGPVPVILNDPCFLLAPPLGFAALVGAMLGRHPQLYGLPETHLFGYETMAEWWGSSTQASFAMAHGLLRAVAQLEFGEQTESAVQLAGGWLRRRLHLCTGALLEVLAERVHPRLLVEKSPSVVYNVESMRRAYAMFPQARFVHLLRHPRDFGEAVLAAIDEAAAQEALPPGHWLLQLCSFPPAPGAQAEAPAEGVLDPQWGWYALNRNIADFLEGVPAAQVYRVRGEHLLTEPDTALPALASWLGLRDDPVAVHEMKHPERSPFARFGPPNATYGDDPSFLQNPALRPGRARPLSLEGALPWRADGGGFAPEVRRLAQEFGYT
jgi:glyoxylase-like metal-dependent hydrolase (beta-lactamase superfamily II)